MDFLVGLGTFLLIFLSFFMIVLILLQRGRGGGLAGAFGGMGSQSAFGTKAGDTFTRITVVVAIIWVILAGGLGMAMRKVQGGRSQGSGLPNANISIEAGENGAQKPGTEGTTLPTGGSKPEITLPPPKDMNTSGPTLPGSAPFVPADKKDDATAPKKDDAAKPDAAKTDAPKTETPAEPKADAPKTEPAKTEEPKAPAEPAKTEEPKAEAKPEAEKKPE